MNRPLTLMFLLVLSGMMNWQAAEARPKYKKCYEEVFKEEIGNSKNSKLTCALCHDGDDKKRRNSYGKKLADELGEKNVTDEDKIKEALKKIGPAPGHKKPEPKQQSEVSIAH